MDTTTLVAALLHDTIEDTDYTLEQMRADFGGEVALLVDGVTKLDKVKLGDAAKAETIRKMVVAMAKDPRVLVIKLADRLHNMRTLTFLPRAQAGAEGQGDAGDPGAAGPPARHEHDQVGAGGPGVRHAVPEAVRGDQPADRRARSRSGRRCCGRSPSRSQPTCKSAKIKAEVTGRPKHLYSIYQKMIVRGRDFNDIYDLVGVRILVDTVRDCYAALGVIHANWQPVPGRFKDYIAMPKFNMYQSLHTTVIGPTGKPVEMQIRTLRDAPHGRVRHRRALEVQGAARARRSSARRRTSTR